MKTSTYTDSELGHWQVFIVTASLSFLTYLQTISPSIAGGDSGELVAEGCQLGTSHPPGYPLYTILVYLATKLGKLIAPWKTPAYFVNLTSAMFGSLASGLLASSILFLVQISDFREKKNICSVTKSNVKHKIVSEFPQKCTTDGGLSSNVNGSNGDILSMCIAIFMGLMHSFSPLAWQYSVTAEVFALHNLFVASITHTSIRFAIHGDKRLLLFGSFLCGLALTNQHTSILLSIPLIVWILSITKLHLPRQWRLESEQLGELCGTAKPIVPLLMKAALTFLSGFVTMYGSMPVFVMMFHHRGSWGDISNFKGFLHHFLRSDYGSLRLYSGNDDGSEGLWERLVLWGTDFMWSQSLPFIAVAAFIASKDILIYEMSKLKKKTKRKGLQGNTGVIVCSEDTSIGIDTAVLCSLLFYLIVFHSLSNIPLQNPLFFGIHQRFWMHPNILCFILAGLGLTKLCRKLTPRDSTLRTTYCSCILLVISIYAHRRGSELSSQSHNVYFRNYAASILKTLPKDSVLFINYDQQWTSIRYMQECEGLRTDITSINLSMMSFNWWSTKHKLYPNITFPGSRYTFHPDGFTFKDLLDVNNGFNGKAFIGGNKLFDEDSYSRQYEEVPHGIVRRIIKTEVITDNTAESYRRESQHIWQIIAKEHSEGLPALSRYRNDTWEWTIRREFFDHFTARASYLLDLAISRDKSTSRKLKSIVEACAWLEVTRMNDEMSNMSPGLWKNLGLGYMKIVQNDENFHSFPNVKDIFAKTENSQLFESIKKLWWSSGQKVDWKGWSSLRWEESWGHFLQMKDAEADPSYQQVKALYDIVLKKMGK